MLLLSSPEEGTARKNFSLVQLTATTEQETKERIQLLTERIQEECHYTVQAVSHNEKVSYQDATNVFLFTKIAELQVANEQLIDLYKQSKTKQG